MRTVRQTPLLIALVVIHLLSVSRSTVAQLDTEQLLLKRENEKPPEKTIQQIQESQATYQLIDRRDQTAAAGSQPSWMFQRDLTIGRQRAEQMVNMLRDEEMRIALERITIKGNEVLSNNPELHTPIGVIAGAFALWAGRTVQLFRSENTRVSTHISGRNRSGHLNLECPLFNGQLQFDPAQGVSLGVNRSISSTNTSANMQYHVNSGTFSTGLVQPLISNFSLSVGASQCIKTNVSEGSARLQFDLNF